MTTDWAPEFTQNDVVVLEEKEVFSGSVYAEDLLRVYQLAQINDPAMQAAKEKLLADQEACPQAYALFLPVISGTGSVSRTNIRNLTTTIFPFLQVGSFTGVTFPPTFNYSGDLLALNLVQPVFYYQQWVQLSKAGSIVRQANASYIAAEQDLIVRTVQAYFEVLKAFDTLKFATAQRVSFSSFLEQTTERFKAGITPTTDVQVAKARHDSAYADEIAAQNALSNKKVALQEITGIGIDTFAKLRQDLILRSPEPANEEAWVKKGQEENFTLQAFRFQTEASRMDIKLNQANHFPIVNINGSVIQTSATPLTTRNINSTIGLQVTVPIFSGGSITSKTRQAMHIYGQTFQQMELLSRQVETKTRQSFRGVLTQINQIKAFRQAVHSNKTALNANNDAFKVGTRTIIDVLNSQTDLTREQLNYANARYEYILQGIQLKQAAGILTPADICQINALLGSDL